MKILLVNKFHYMKGGSETYYFGLADALRKIGHEVICFSMHDGKNLPCEQDRYFVSNTDYNKKHNFLSQLYFGIKSIYSFESKRKFKELVINEKPDIVHIGLAHRHLTLSILDVTTKYKIPVVYSLHDLIAVCPCYTMLSYDGICRECLDYGFRQCIKKKCIKGSSVKSLLAVIEAVFLSKMHYYNKIDMYIAECSFYKSMLEQSLFTKSPIVSMTNFLPSHIEYKLCQNNDGNVLFFGRFSPEKGITTLIHAYLESGMSGKLLLVGAGPEEKELKKIIANKQCGDSVKLLGAIYGKDMELLIEKSKMIVVPSEWYENCPYTIMEAMAKGKPVIASNIGGLPELVDDKKTGSLFEPGNVKQLSDSLRFIDSLCEVEYRNMCEATLIKAKKTFSWKQYAEWLENEYLILISNKHKGYKNSDSYL